MDRVEKINGLPLWDTILRTDINNFEPMINDKADKNHKHDEYLTKVEAADKYATLIYLTTEINKIIGLIDNIDLSHLVTKDELENKKYLTKVPDEYITESELNAMGFIKNQQDISGYTTTTYLNSEINTLKNWVDDNYAKKIELDALRARLQQLEDEIDKLKKDMDDMEADVDGLEVVVEYSITYKLTNVSSTNITSNITGENNSYSTTLNPSKSNYEIDNVTVTMGGTNITSSVVSGDSTRKAVNISKVTGNIVITATAKKVNVPCTGVSFNISSQEIAIGQIFSLHGHISVSPSNCTDEIETWSNNHSIARVSGYSVYGESAGSTTIYVQCGNYTDSCTIYVS